MPEFERDSAYAKALRQYARGVITHREFVAKCIETAAMYGDEATMEGFLTRL